MTAAPAAPISTSARTFIYGLADDEGRLDTEFLYAAAAAAGFTTTKLRLAIRRMAEARLLRSTGRGRSATTRLTPAGIADRSPELAWVGAAYRADAGLDEWDGRWHLAAFEIPEEQRLARDAVRTHLLDLFGAPISGGLYVSPLAWEPWILRLASSRGVPDRITLIETDSLTHAGYTHPADVAAVLWPVREIHTGYRSFFDEWGARVDAVPDDPLEALRFAFDAAHEFELVFRRDPLLPRPLVPDDFAGPPARRLFLDLLDALSDHPELADASLFHSYRNAVDRALAQDEGEFWRLVFEETSAR
ncbi:MAG: PaaX family transcriptional regulator C-terminal domain-containing protein [Actinomycetota bacterium]